jgi:hypothetical protein
MAVAMTGLLVTAVGVVGVNVVFFPSMPKLSNRQLMRAAPSVAFEFVLRLLLCAAVATIGLTILLLGLVLTGGLVAYAPARATRALDPHTPASLVCTMASAAA